MMYVLPSLLVIVQDVAERIAGTGRSAAVLGQVLEAEVQQGEGHADDAEGDERELIDSGEDEAESEERPDLLGRHHVDRSLRPRYSRARDTPMTPRAMSVS